MKYLIRKDSSVVNRQGFNFNELSKRGGCMRRKGWELRTWERSPLAWGVAGPSGCILTSSQQSCVQTHETHPQSAYTLASCIETYGSVVHRLWPSRKADVLKIQHIAVITVFFLASDLPRRDVRFQFLSHCKHQPVNVAPSGCHSNPLCRLPFNCTTNL